MTLSDLLQRLQSGDLDPGQTDKLFHELATAYHIDEAASSSRDVVRIAEKIRALMRQSGTDEPGNP